MASLEDRLAESRAKIVPPFVLDDSMRFYSPQDNLDALDHPRVRSFTRFVRRTYQPDLPPGEAIALLIPCTKHKPYSVSLEHRRINAALLRAGFQPAGDIRPPDALYEVLDPDEDPQVLNAAPLVRQGRVVHRYVVSEPLALVPYELIYTWRGKQSPAASYDDPGLFEHRGTSVAPWRSDCTAIPVGSNGRWRWGDNERMAYVQVHTRLSRSIAETLFRLGDVYARRIAWVAPGLTHRSFMLAAGDRGREGVTASRRIGGRRERLVGVNDLFPGLVEVRPSRVETEAALERLRERMRKADPQLSERAVLAVYARGGGGATPLALPELLDGLVDALIG